MPGECLTQNACAHKFCLVEHLIHRPKGLASRRKRSPFPKGEGKNYLLDFTKYQGKIMSAYRHYTLLLPYANGR